MKAHHRWAPGPPDNIGNETARLCNSTDPQEQHAVGGRGRAPQLDFCLSFKAMLFPLAHNNQLWTMWGGGGLTVTIKNLAAGMTGWQQGNQGCSRLHPRPRNNFQDLRILPTSEHGRRTITWSNIVFFFFESVTEDSCISPIFFIFSSISIFCSSFLISDFRRRRVSSLWWCLATAAAQAEWMAVIQFSSSVWLVVCGGWGAKKETAAS